MRARAILVGFRGESIDIGTLRFAPKHELFISCPSKFSLPSSRASSDVLFSYVVYVRGIIMAGIEQASQSAASAVPGQIIDEESFQSKRVLAEDQRSRAISLEPAFERLLHDVGVGEATIWALRHARINDRETFTGLVEETS